MSGAYDHIDQLLEDFDNSSPSELIQLLSELKQSKRNLVTARNDQNQLVKLHKLLQDKLNKCQSSGFEMDLSNRMDMCRQIDPSMSSRSLNSPTDLSFNQNQVVVRETHPKAVETTSNNSSFCLRDIGNSLRQLQEQLNVDMVKLKNQLTNRESKEEEEDEDELDFDEKNDKNLFLHSTQRLNSSPLNKSTQLQIETQRRKWLENKLRQLQSNKIKVEDILSDSYERSHLDKINTSSFRRSILEADDETMPDEEREGDSVGDLVRSKNRMQTSGMRFRKEVQRPNELHSSNDLDQLAERFHEIQKMQTRVKQIEQMIQNFEGQHSEGGMKLTIEDKNRNDVGGDYRTKDFDDFEPQKYFKRSDQNINRVSRQNELTETKEHLQSTVLDTSLLKEQVISFFQTHFNSLIHNLQNESVSVNPLLATQQLINCILTQNNQLLNHQQSLLVWFQQLQCKLILSKSEADCFSMDNRKLFQVHTFPSSSFNRSPPSHASIANDDLLEHFSAWNASPFVFHNVTKKASKQLNWTLNNQVEPGIRANNFWDNFKSQSRQNQLRNFSKNSETIVSPLIKQSRSHANRVSLNSVGEDGATGECLNMTEIINSSLSSSSSMGQLQKMNTAKKLPNNRANQASNVSANESFDKQPKVNQISLLYEMLEKLINEKHDRKQLKSAQVKMQTISTKTLIDESKLGAVGGEDINNFNDLTTESSTSVDMIHSSIASTRSVAQQNLNNGTNGINSSPVSSSSPIVSNVILNANGIGRSKAIQIAPLSKPSGSVRKKFRNKEQLDDLTPSSISELIDKSLVSNEIVRPLMAADGQSSEVIVTTTPGQSSTNSTMISSNSASNSVSSATSNGTHHFLTRPPITGASRSYAKRTAKDSGSSSEDDDVDEDLDELNNSNSLIVMTEQPSDELKGVSPFGDNSALGDASVLIDHRLDYESGIRTPVVATESEVRLSGDGEQGL